MLIRRRGPVVPGPGSPSCIDTTARALSGTNDSMDLEAPVPPSYAIVEVNAEGVVAAVGDFDSWMTARREHVAQRRCSRARTARARAPRARATTA